MAQAVDEPSHRGVGDRDLPPCLPEAVIGDEGGAGRFVSCLLIADQDPGSPQLFKQLRREFARDRSGLAL